MSACYQVGKELQLTVTKRVVAANKSNKYLSARFWGEGGGGYAIKPVRVLNVNLVCSL